jgi:hypothetical protein
MAYHHSRENHLFHGIVFLHIRHFADTSANLLLLRTIARLLNQ